MTFSYTDANHPYCPASGSNGYAAGYAANGNLATKTDGSGVQLRYVYGDENMLAEVCKTPQGGTEALAEEYTYGADGIRTSKINHEGQSAVTTYYVYLGNNVIYEAGATNKKLIWDNVRQYWILGWGL